MVFLTGLVFQEKRRGPAPDDLGRAGGQGEGDAHEHDAARNEPRTRRGRLRLPVHPFIVYGGRSLRQRVNPQDLVTDPSTGDPH